MSEHSESEEKLQANSFSFSIPACDFQVSKDQIFQRMNAIKLVRHIEKRT